MPEPLGEVDPDGGSRGHQKDAVAHRLEGEEEAEGQDQPVAEAERSITDQQDSQTEDEGQQRHQNPDVEVGTVPLLDECLLGAVELGLEGIGDDRRPVGVDQAGRQRAARRQGQLAEPASGGLGPAPHQSAEPLRT